MALHSPTPKSIWEIATLCFDAVFRPQTFTQKEIADNSLLNNVQSSSPPPPIYGVRRALAGSLLLTLLAMVTGAVFAMTLAAALTDRRLAIGISGGVGALVLLWATLAIRGWEIQTIGGGTLTERVNQRIFRFLYWIGTALLTVAAVLSAV
jgi:hypothetical protein